MNGPSAEVVRNVPGRKLRFRSLSDCVPIITHLVVFVKGKFKIFSINTPTESYRWVRTVGTPFLMKRRTKPQLGENYRKLWKLWGSSDPDSD